LKLHERLKVFIWRLGSNALPTKVNLAHHIGLGDFMCTLCGESEEPFSHLFLQCKVVRPLWFGSCWGIRSELIPTSTNADFVKLVVKPPICQTSIRDAALMCAQTSIHFALLLECIWNLRNQVLHNNSPVHIESVVRHLEAKILEHLQILNPLVSPSVVPNLTWIPPPPNMVKLNMDAAVNNKIATIAVVARKSDGYILFCSAKRILMDDPCFAETAAIA
jgi:hypothetical protein